MLRLGGRGQGARGVSARTLFTAATCETVQALVRSLTGRSPNEMMVKRGCRTEPDVRCMLRKDGDFDPGRAPAEMMLRRSSEK